MHSLEGKVAIVTGAARGIGKGIANCLAQEGCTVVIADMLKNIEEKTVNELIDQGMKGDYYQVNLLEESEIEELMKYVYDTYGRIDILVNNAGITVREPAITMKSSDFDRVLGVNMRTYFLASRSAARYMRNQPEKGNIVCISSATSECCTSRRSPYNISKAAVNGLVATLGVEWGRIGIRINAVAPGYVMTDMVDEGIKQGIIEVEKIMTVIPMKRFVLPEEIGRAVCFLASENASAITGQTLFVDGGLSKCGFPETKDMEV